MWYFQKNVNFKSIFWDKLNSVVRIPALRLITKNNLGMHQSSQTWIPGPCRQLAGLMGLVVNVNVGVVLLVYEMNYYVQADWVEIKNIPIARAWSLGQLVFSKKACI